MEENSIAVQEESDLSQKIKELREAAFSLRTTSDQLSQQIRYAFILHSIVMQNLLLQLSAGTEQQSATRQLH